MVRPNNFQLKMGEIVPVVIFSLLILSYILQDLCIILLVCNVHVSALIATNGDLLQAIDKLLNDHQLRSQLFTEDN